MRQLELCCAANVHNWRVFTHPPVDLRCCLLWKNDRTSVASRTFWRFFLLKSARHYAERFAGDLVRVMHCFHLSFDELSLHSRLPCESLIVRVMLRQKNMPYLQKGHLLSGCPSCLFTHLTSVVALMTFALWTLHPPWSIHVNDFCSRPFNVCSCLHRIYIYYSKRNPQFWLIKVAANLCDLPLQECEPEFFRIDLMSSCGCWVKMTFL